MHRSYAEIERLDRAKAIAILPIGATEAHGPHLPLTTDIIIAEAMARSGAERLSEAGLSPFVLPTLPFAPAEFAVNFAGTVSINDEAFCAWIVDIARSLARHGFRWLVAANAHFDPANITAINDAADRCRRQELLQLIFPDVTKKPWALRLSEEFKSGACHAGRYEGSIVLAERPELVRGEIAAQLPANPSSLSQAIRAGQTRFEQAGGPQAYFGAPALASAEEGRQMVKILGEILHDAVQQTLGR